MPMRSYVNLLSLYLNVALFFFRKQDNLISDLQKELVQRIGLLSGKPSTSGLHTHPLLNPEREGYRVTDLEISTIDSHADISFEPKPADYSSLKLEVFPKTRGDTLWASGYEIYGRISNLYQKFLEGLTVTFQQPGFIETAEKGGFELYDKPRGAPENVGKELKAVHPVVRTNPVTGWKTVFPVGGHVSHINDVTQLESEALLGWLKRLLVDNHDLQVRFKWKNDLAIWDNRSAFHTATDDLEGPGERYGVRAVSVGESPFLDPENESRRDALGI